MNPAWSAVLMEIDVESGSTRRLGSARRFGISDLHFLADGSALLMTATDAESAREQIWLQPYPEGAPVRLTNDLSAYRGLWPTRDDATIAAIRRDDELSFAPAEVGDTSHRPAVLSGLEQVESNSVSAAATGTLVYANLTRGTSGVSNEIMVTDTTGTAPRALTRGGENFSPAISRDGRTILFSAESTAAPPRIYAIGADGSNLRPLTDGAGETDPSVSGDGRMFAYLAAQGAEVWVRPLEGGEARRITDRNSGSEPGLSPDGRFVFFTEWLNADGESLHLKVVPVTGGTPLLDIPIDRAAVLRWHPRGDTITFRRTDAGVANVFGIAVATGELRQITRFERGTFTGYAWIDDDSLIIVPSRNRSDVVLISNWRRTP
jgi:dipeptidyl aminopeptidase/acylaminoacyl peptidase